MGKKKGRKSDPVRKWIRRGVSWLGTAIGLFAATSPAHPGLQALARGDFASGSSSIAYNYGVPGPADPNFNVQRLINAGLATAGGIVVIALFRALAKRV